MTVALAILLLGWVQDDPLRAAALALEEGRPAEALGLFERAATAAPDNADIHFQIGFCRGQLGQLETAVAAYRQALALRPGFYEATLNLGLTLVRAKKSADALAPLAKAAELKPAEFRPRLLLARTLYELGRVAESEAEYAKATQLDPKSSDAWAGLGQTLGRLDKFAESAAAFERAVALEPANKAFQLKLGDAYEQAKQPGKAIAVYQKLTSEPAARERLGVLYLQQGDNASAVRELEAVNLSSPTPASRLALATAYMRTAQPSQAVPLVQEVLEGNPSNVEIRLMYARLQRDLRRFPLAIKEFRTVVEAQPDNAGAWNELAGLLLIGERYEESLTALEKVRALGGETPAYHYFRALALDAMHQPKPALESYRKFLELSKGEHPEEEFKARQRARILEKAASK